MLEVKRKDGESFESLVRRFSKKTLQSGKLIQAKKIMFHQKPLSKLSLKEKAQKREEFKSYREYLRRIGKLEEWLQARKKNRSTRRN